jgi:4'-phosphopantetheinyl transferase
MLIDMSDSDTQWCLPPPEVVLSPNEVHVWCASLEAAPSTIQSLQHVLSAEEVARADRFRFARDRQHFIVARGLLRTLLGRYLQMAPEDLCFVYNAYGKPTLTTPSFPDNLSHLQFNLSHSRELALFAFTPTRLIGIDIEYMRADIEYEQLAKHYFSTYEYAMLQEVPAEMQREAFYRCWTRKEAYIKARGKGLSLPLDLFDVSLRPGEPAALLNSREDPQEHLRWSLHTLTPGANYAAALAVQAIEGIDWQLKCWRYLDYP